MEEWKRKYRKEQKTYIRNLVGLIKKEEAPYDWFTMAKIIMMMLERRLEYFQHGYNVWQTDVDRAEKIKTLKEAVRLGKFAMDDNNFYTGYISDYLKEYAPEEYKKYKEELPIKKLTGKMPQDSYKNFEFNYKAQIYAYEYWMAYVGTHIMDWWD